MNNKNKNLLFTALLLSVLLAACSGDVAETGSADESAGRANILLIISDDFGVDVTSDMYPGLIDSLVARYGPEGLNHPQYSMIQGSPASTPVLDQFARQGMIFSNMWAHPFCSPTRASLITGLYANEMKVANYRDPLAQKHTTFVELLKESGYSTGLFGKWHLAGLPGQPVDYPGIKPMEAGFEVFKGNLHAAIASYWDYDYHIQDDNTPADQWRNQTPPVKSLPGIAPSNYAPLVKVADTLEWIHQKEAENPDKPWFAWLAFNLSHATTIQRPSAMAVPNADTLDEQSRLEMAACGGEFGSNNTGTCSGESLMRAMTNSVDTILGKLLDAVDEIDPNTYIIFVSDNGTPMYGRPNLDFIDNMYITRSGRGKGTAYESGARVALAVKGPGIKANSESREFAHAADLFSTSLALAGVPVPTRVSNSDGSAEIPVDGVSLAPILLDQTQTVRDPNQGFVLTETENLMTGGTRMVGARNGTYKVVCTDGFGTDNCEFYNLIDDPLEEYPLAEPASCAAYADSLSPVDESWHFCRLAEVIEQRSFM